MLRKKGIGGPSYEKQTKSRWVKTTIQLALQVGAWSLLGSD